MTFSSITKEDRWGLIISVGVHLLLILFAIFYSTKNDQQMRRSYIEVTVGQFASGTAAEYAREKNEDVATRPNPTEAEPTEEQTEKPTVQEQQVEKSEETSKQVKTPEQEQEVDNEPVKTPETEKVDPKKETADEKQEEKTVPSTAEESEEVKEGEKVSGDKRGATGEVNVDQGSGKDPTKAAPYELKWEGNLEREPQVKTLPQYNAQVEAEIRVRFEVRPDGSVGRIVPLKKMNPELENEVYRTLRGWRFDRLPSSVPQESQWGTITFHFVLD